MDLAAVISIATDSVAKENITNHAKEEEKARFCILIFNLNG